MVSDTELDTSAATNAEMVPEIWASDTRDAIEYKEIVTKLVNTTYESQMRIGDIFHIPLRANLTTQSKSEGISNTITFEAINEAEQTVTVSTFEYAAQLLGNVLAIQSNYDERQRITHAIGYALVRGIEVTITALFQTFSQIVGTLGADIDDGILRRAWQYLADSAVDSDANWVFGPAAVASLFGNDKFTSKDFVSGQSAIETAKLPTLYSYPSYVSNLLRNPATGQTDCALFHREAIILIRQLLPTIKQQYLIRNDADGILGVDLYTADEANWVAETPGSNSTGDFGAVLIRSA